METLFSNNDVVLKENSEIQSPVKKSNNNKNNRGRKRKFNFREFVAQQIEDLNGNNNNN